MSGDSAQLDLAQFQDVFFEECAEHLDSMESLLLSIDIAAPAAEDLNAIFRAGHSIKGGSGTFGFQDIAEVTHVLETLLDRLRKGQRSLHREMVDVLLHAVDVLRMQLAGHRHGAAVDAAAVHGMHRQLEAMSDGSPAPAAKGDRQVPTRGGDQRGGPCASGGGPARAPTEAAAAERSLVVAFTFGGKLVRGEDAFSNVMAYLRSLGRIEKTAADDTTMRVSLRATADDAEILDAFAFAAEPGQVWIEQSAGAESGGAIARAIDSGASCSSPAVANSPQPGAAGASQSDTAGAPTSVAASQPATADTSQPATAGGEATAAASSAAPAPVPAAQSPAASRPRGADGAAPASTGESSIRVSVEKVDHLINLVGELVITQAMLVQAAAGELSLGRQMEERLQQLERNTRDLQQAVMSIRMLPMSFVFSRFPRLVRDLCGKLGKQVELKALGENTELDKGVIERLADPLTHLVRNSLDHGLESPAERVATGKEPAGTLTLSACHQGGNVVIEVSDDGRGLDRARIIAKARERGMAVSESMADAEVWQIAFAPGLSTAAQVTDVSGRGVGMDVVKKNIEGMGGRVEIESSAGRGTTVRIRLPLTLAIMDGLSVRVADHVYIVPLTAIVESVRVAPGDVKSVSGEGRVVNVRGAYLPVVALHDVLRIGGSAIAPEDAIMIIVDAEGTRAALLVDELLGQHQVVIKSLESNYRRVRGVSAATIMGDGSVALILDVAETVRMGREARPALRLVAGARSGRP